MNPAPTPQSADVLAQLDHQLAQLSLLLLQVRRTIELHPHLLVRQNLDTGAPLYPDTVEDVAKAFNMAPSTIRKLAAAGDIPALKMGKAWRFNLAEVERSVKQPPPAHA